MEAAGVGDQWWSEARAAFDESPEFVMLGEKRGARYTTRRAIQAALAKVIRKAGKAGVSKSEAIERMAEQGFQLEDSDWTSAVKALLDLGRISREGQAKGTRYYA